jgi:hypothetical protein
MGRNREDQDMGNNETTTTTEYRAARVHPDGLIPVTDWGGRDDAVDGAAHAERVGSGRVIVQQRTVTYGPISKAPMTKLLAEYGS